MFCEAAKASQGVFQAQPVVSTGFGNPVYSGDLVTLFTEGDLLPACLAGFRGEAYLGTNVFFSIFSILPEGVG